MSLKIRLGPGERIVINGALVQTSERCTLVLLNNASFLTEKHIMRPEEASTPARRIYFMIQNSYMATDAERPPMLELLNRLIDDFHDATSVPEIKEILDGIRGMAARGDYYRALKQIDAVMQHEDRHLGNTSWQETRKS